MPLERLERLTGELAGRGRRLFLAIRSLGMMAAGQVSLNPNSSVHPEILRHLPYPTPVLSFMFVRPF